MRKVLFTNLAVAHRSGTETFLWDLAGGLKKLGWECGIYCPRTGPMAEEFVAAGIPVWDRLEAVEFQPDILHGQHTLEALGAAVHFPDVPALFMVHDAVAWHDRVLPWNRWSAVVAVDDPCRERVVRETGLKPEQVTVLRNSVDLDVFGPSAGGVADRARRAAVFTSNALHQNHVHLAREACQKLGIPLDELGHAVGNPVARPAGVLPQYDLVFAKGRLALEAMASGCAVILLGPEGAGPMVREENFAELGARNFGWSLLAGGMDADFLVREMERYSVEEIRRVQELVRQHWSLDRRVVEFATLYEELHGAVPVFPDELPGGVAPLLAAVLENLVQHHRQTADLKSALAKSRGWSDHYRSESLRYKARVADLKRRVADRKEPPDPRFGRLAGWRDWLRGGKDRRGDPDR